MNKNKLFTYLIILVIIFILIFILLFITNNQPSDLNEDEIQMTDYNQAIFSGNSSDCLKLEDSRQRNTCLALYDSCDNDECYSIKGIQTLDTRYCQSINDSNLRVSCNSEVSRRTIVETSIEQRNKEICNNFQSDDMIQSCEDSYYFTVSQLDNDLSLCDNIKNRGMRNECSQN